MLIELAHYTLLFALTVIGLQTFLLCPTLWSGGSAVVIKLGFRGVCFTTTLLFFSFFVLLSGFAVHDFSLAIVFEAFDSQNGPLYALQAFCSSREGFFFTFIILLTTVFLTEFSKHELATYQERGRYLFAGGCILFSLLTLMIISANPFARIENPPFEGIGFNSAWRPPYKILSVLFSFSSCAVLTISLIKTLCMYSKGRRFVRSALRNSLIASLLILCALGIELLTGFTTADNGLLWQWTPNNSLLLSVLLLTIGQSILSFFCLSSPVFINWIIAFSLLSVAFSNASFFAGEYRLFSSSTAETYFPNPVTALCAVAGLFCFFLFLCSVTLKKSFQEKGFYVFSRESFIGLSVTALLAAGVSFGSLSLLPTLFMFWPDLPLRLLPDLLKSILHWTGLIFVIFFFIAFKRRSVIKGWSEINRKNTILFWSAMFVCACLCLYNMTNGLQIVLYSLPAVLLLETVISKTSFKIPSSFKEMKRQLRSVSAFKYASFFCAFGFLIFSTALACSVFNRTENVFTIKIQSDSEKNDFPCSIERLSGKSNASGAQYRLVCKKGVQLLTGNLNFQWKEKELQARFLQTKLFSTRLIQVDQIQEDDLKLRIIDYPSLQLAGSGVFLICLGILFFLFSIKKENAS